MKYYFGPWRYKNKFEFAICDVADKDAAKNWGMKNPISIEPDELWSMAKLANAVWNIDQESVGLFCVFYTDDENNFLKFEEPDT